MIKNNFLWGVATSGYQSEGGYNGVGQPQNNWSESEQKGKVMRTGNASEFWTRYQEDFSNCQELGLNSFRLSLEWSRIQPTITPEISPAPNYNFKVLDDYAKRIATCRQYGLEPIVTLHHFTHPAWLGIDAWLSSETIDGFIDYVTVSVTHINQRLTDYHQQPPIHWYITINEPNILVLNTYLSRQFPSGTFTGIKAVWRAYNHLLAAHIRAYNSIHDIYEKYGWNQPMVTLNTYCSDLYWSEKVIWDLLGAQEKEIKPKEIRDYVYAQAKHLETSLRRASLPFQKDIPYQLGRLARWTGNRVGHRTFDLKHLDYYWQELILSPRPKVYDYLAIDYYDPFIAHTFRLPSFSDFEFKTKGLRNWLMTGIMSKWWDWRALPEGLSFFCKYYAQEYNLPILIAENGMALRRKPDNSIATRRSDQLHRSQFLEAHVRQIQQLLRENIPILGYMHWSLTDNYEWGSYTPRFGLFSINFHRGTEREIEDHLGDRPSETYAKLIREMQS
ncbi:Beta-glucosidase/6-phospho-beta-glucosidase/beta-galactosidase [Planktothrix sp. PCC 11201]|uniref:glycoside hydrolase family 1 protein n=2 Tax=Planktothrix sp. PCC 11201 TaxID=1729650 RepID=UPI0009188730|nr:family 1 glycosylhydrolase [Planktothrix sp. PCC 11201]SKB15736.1 Beta-glucosidase/6-phospho-beta-glucosidase/beta-galactosidase [Planktothrix sp. PCC 11201]